MATQFQQEVWAALSNIPRGRVASYADVAEMVGRPGASRAVGSACGANPKLVEVPCHRVVASDGRIGQYAQGTEQKIALLEREGVEVSDNKVVHFERLRYRM